MYANSTLFWKIMTETLITKPRLDTKNVTVI